MKWEIKIGSTRIWEMIYICKQRGWKRIGDGCGGNDDDGEKEDKGVRKNEGEKEKSCSQSVGLVAHVAQSV
jgi:hypothetical protein